MKRLKKWAGIFVFATIGLVALGFVVNNVHYVLSETSDAYRKIFDRPVFTRLTQITPEEAIAMSVYVPSEDGNDIAVKDGAYHGDMTFFADLEYVGSALSGYELPRERGEGYGFSATAWLQNGYVLFIQCKDDIFEVVYKNRCFYVKSPQLLADIT